VHKDKAEQKKTFKARIRKRIRAKIRGTAERPRVHVFKSNAYVYLQAINDQTGTVLATASTLEKDFREKSGPTKNIAACERLAKVFARRLKDRKIETIVFDRGVYPYHGRVKALAEALRKEGLAF